MVKRQQEIESPIYKLLTEIPNPSTAYFASPEVIQLSSNFTDHLRNAKRTVNTTLVLSDVSVTQYQQQNDSSIVCHALSESKSLSAILREVSDSGKIKRYVEVWRQNVLEANSDVTERHGAFYSDEYFSSFSFSQSETSLLYVAEATPLKENVDGCCYEKFRFKPDFGEGTGTVGKKSPTIFLFSWSNSGEEERNCNLISLSIPSLALFAQPEFSSDGKRIYVTGYEYAMDYRLLGIRYCKNRPSGIFEITPSASMAEGENEDKSAVTCSVKKLTPSHLSCRSPRLLRHNGIDILFWLSCPTGGPHAATSLLYSFDTSTPNVDREINPLVDIVFDPAPEAFPGLYPDYNLPLMPFLHPPRVSSPFLLTHSVWRSRSTIILISTIDGAVKELTPEDGKLYSWKVLNTDGHSRFLCTRSTLTSPPELLLGEIDDVFRIQWRVIQKPILQSHLDQALSKLSSSIIESPGRSPTESIVLKSGKQPNPEVPPCILMPHGGPHSTSTTAFSPTKLAFALEGYTICCPNYTGSLGFGETAVRALPGNCGILDVEDCIATVQHLVALGLATEGRGKLFVYGGSHGGFLAAHLIGQYPDIFTAAIIMNPIISAGEMACSTDVPDWCFSEFGIRYPLYSSPADIGTASSSKDSNQSYNGPPPTITPEIFSKLYRSSPIAHVQNVRAAVLLMIGSVDRRVPPVQGIEYYHALKGRNVNNTTEVQKGEVELLLFDGESHPIDGVEASRAEWEMARDFLQKSRIR